MVGAAGNGCKELDVVSLARVLTVNQISHRGTHLHRHRNTQLLDDARQYNRDPQNPARKSSVAQRQNWMVHCAGGEGIGEQASPR